MKGYLVKRTVTLLLPVAVYLWLQIVYVNTTFHLKWPVRKKWFVIFMQQLSQTHASLELIAQIISTKRPNSNECAAVLVCKRYAELFQFHGNYCAEMLRRFFFQ